MSASDPSPTRSLPPPAYPFLAPPTDAGDLGRLGRYRVLAAVGEGGMGLVFRAFDTELERTVALKVVRPAVADRPESLKRFRQEAAAAAALTSDHVVPAYDFGEANGCGFLVMPLLAGEPLSVRLARDGPMTPDEVARIGEQVAAGLAVAHAAGIVHRDIKPSNLWLETTAAPPGWRVRVLDFGLMWSADIPSLTPDGAVIGTPQYMSPEQAGDRTVDGRSDLFSLGTVLYEAATGNVVFRRSTVSATLHAVETFYPRRPEVVRAGFPPPLSALILSLLEKNPADRPPTAADAGGAFARFLSGSLDDTIAWTGGNPYRKFLSRRAALAAGGVAALAAVGLIVRGGSGSAPPGTGPTAVPTAGSPIAGTVDVWVVSRDGKPVANGRLRDRGTLPVRPGDKFRVEATVRPGGFAYLFWLTTDGEVLPVYPWKNGQWGTRPAAEAATATVSLPPGQNAFTMQGDRTGLETLILVARDSPWTATDDDIRGLFAGLTPQLALEDGASVVWFENGQVVTAAKNQERGPNMFSAAAAVNNPVLQMVDLLQTRLGPHAAATAAVSFAKVVK